MTDRTTDERFSLGSFGWFPALMTAILYIQVMIWAQPLHEPSVAYRLSGPMRRLLGEGVSFWVLSVGHNILTLLIGLASWRLLSKTSPRFCLACGFALLLCNVIALILWSEIARSALKSMADWLVP